MADSYPGLDPSNIDKIVNDVVLGVPIEESRVTYGDAEKQFRADVEAWMAENPDAVVDMPFDAASAEMKIPELEGEG